MKLSFGHSRPPDYNTIIIVSVLSVVCSVCVDHTSGTDTQPSAQRHLYPASYFGVLKDYHAQLQFFGDEENRVRARNVSDGVNWLFHRINSLLVEEEREAGFNELVKLLRPGFGNEKTTRDEINEKGDESEVGADDKDDAIPADADDVLGLLRDVSVPVNASAVGSHCVNDTGRLLVGLINKKLWAVQFFDATGKPGPSITQLRLTFIGNYDQCRASVAPPDSDQQDGDVGFKGKFSIIVAKARVIPVEIKLGSCWPDTCSDSEITTLLYQLFSKQIASKSISYIYSYTLTGTTSMTAATKAAIAILSLIGSLMFLGTMYDLLIVHRPSLWRRRSSLVSDNPTRRDLTKGRSLNASQRHEENGARHGEKSPLLPSSPAEPGDSKTSPADAIGTPAQVLLSFSVYSNAKKVLNTAQSSSSLGSIHGIRFLSMSWVLLCHTFAFVSPFALNLATAAPQFYQRSTFLPISNGFVSVDTFFTLSGLLTSYLTVKEMMARNTWKINWLLFYFHRFWRLTPPYMFVLVIVLGLNQYLGQGPMWSPVQPYDKSNCEDNWWTNLLYVNNLVNLDKGCFGHSWYLANDMQFFVLSPLMLVPFFFHRVAGYASCGVFLLVSTVTTGVLSSVRDWPPTSVSLRPVPGRADATEWMQDYYVVPWCRIGPFVVGVIAGYLLARTKGLPFRMARWVVALGWMLSAGAGLSVVYGLHGDIKGDNPSSSGAAAFYNAVNRSVWGACVSWVVVACSAGYGGPVNALLSWSPFVVLGRLTYMSYLIHPCIIYVFYQNLDVLFNFNDTNIVAAYLGILLFVNMAAFVCVLSLESPMLGLEKTFIKKTKRE